MTRILASASPRARSAVWTAVLTLGGVFAGAAATALIFRPYVKETTQAEQMQETSEPALAEATTKSEPELDTRIELPRASWQTAGIILQAAKVDALPDTIQVTGKIALNADRVAHIYPLVEGRVDQVLVKFGDQVKKGDDLVIIQSKEVGAAKLALFQDRMARDFAIVKNDWAQIVEKNAKALIDTIRAGASITEVEESFRNRPMGEYREKLLAAYVNLHKSRVEFERLGPLSKNGITPGKQLLAAEAARDGDRATLQAWLEQIEQESRHSALLAEQALKEAETRVSVDETNLSILGYDASELSEVNPASEGEAISHYPVRSPFNGTIISKDVVLLERVGPDQQVLSIADLSTVWVTADIYEQHLPLLKSWAGQKVTVCTEVWGDHTFEAEVFSTGEIVDESSRTLSMRAIADNSEGRLKPGMFVNIVIPNASDAPLLQLPLSAVQEHDGHSFVFVHLEGEAFERRDVTLGRKNKECVEIKSGVSEGEQVAVQGGFALKSRMLSALMSED
jgi:cobalt-zinc-cadmium efflux system membrane fusion protein